MVYEILRLVSDECWKPLWLPGRPRETEGEEGAEVDLEGTEEDEGADGGGEEGGGDASDDMAQHGRRSGMGERSAHEMKDDDENGSGATKATAGCARGRLVVQARGLVIVVLRERYGRRWFIVRTGGGGEEGKMGNELTEKWSCPGGGFEQRECCKN